MANFGNWDVQFDPVGFAGEMAKRMGQGPSDSSFMSNPFGHMAMALGQQPSSAASTAPQITPPDTIAEKDQEFDEADKEKKKNAIVPPTLIEAAKTAKIKDPEMGMMQQLIKKGVNPITDPHKFLSYFDATAGQNDMMRSWGPLEGIRDVISADSQALRARQQGILEVGKFFTKKLLEQEAERLGAPKDIGSLESVLPGAIPHTDIQKENKIEEPRRGDAVNMIGPMPGIQNYHTPLEPWQQDMAMKMMGGLGSGAMTRTEEGIVPTSTINAQGRLMNPAQVAYADKAAQTDPSLPIPPAPGLMPPTAVNNIIDTRNKTTTQRLQSNVTPEVAEWAAQAVQTPPDQPLPPVPQGVILPPTVMNKVMEERGQMSRQVNKGPEYEKRVESAAAVYSMQKHGRVMSFGQLVQADPEGGAIVRKQADLDEPKEIYAFQTDQQFKRAIAQAGPVRTAQAEAERDQPVHEPQLWRDPYSGKAADPQMTTRQAQNEKYVKLRPDQVETVNQLDVIDNGLQVIRDISKKVLSPKAGSPGGEVLRSLGQTAYLKYLRMTGDPDMVLMDSAVARLTAPLVKSQGDTANIAVAEREMFAKALVNNQASSEAVLANLDNVLATTRSARSMMGFKSKEDLVASMLQSGMSKEEIKKALKKRGLIK